MLERLQDWWRRRSKREQVHGVLLLLVTVGALIHQALLWHWYIEDAAISFAFARNAADGYGLVPTPGGERVEGYSNPSWVFLLTVCELIGLNSFRAAKIIQLVCAGLTVPLTYLLTRRAAAREHSDAPLFAAIFLAMNSQFAIWGASGLENALFNLLLVTALWRMFEELRAGALGEERRPWSALAWFGLAVTRPEALAYAAIGGLFSMIFSVADSRGIRPTLRWLAVFWIPFTAYHAIRFDYFAWELPQTFYAKIGDHREPKPFTWNSQGWNYFRGWARGMGQGLLFPVYVVGIIGPRPGRALVGLAIAFAWGLSALLPTDQRMLLPVVLVFTFLCYVGLVRAQQEEPQPRLVLAGLVPVLGFIAAAEWMRVQGAQSNIPAPDWMVQLPPVLAVVCACAIPWLAIGGRGARVRSVCWALVASGLFYAVLVHGDWMRSWRWMSLVAVPSAVLLGVGAESIAQLAQATLTSRTDRLPSWLGAAALLLAPLPANVIGTWNFVEKPETGPYSVYERVRYKNQLKDKLHWYGPVVDLDVDMGAHMWWTEHRMLDIAGLVDIPFAQHRFDRGFVREYVFTERRPHFAHLHGGWAGNSRIPTHPEWRQEYVEIPGYPTGDMLHIGNHIRRDLVLKTDWSQPEDRRVMFDRGVELVGWRVPSPEVAADRRLYLEVAIQTHRRLELDFRIVAFLSDASGEHVASWDLAPAHDWIPVRDWRRTEVMLGTYSPLVPERLPEGSYDLGFALIDVGGRPIVAAPNYSAETPAEKAPKAVLGGVDRWPARLIRGEVRFPNAVQIVSEAAMEQASRDDRDRALGSAAEGSCEDAEEWWFQSRSHRPKATTWFERAGPEVDRAIADCHAARATDDPDAAVEHLLRARDWDFESPAVRRATRPVAARRWDEGMAQWEAGDPEAAYQAFRDVIRLEPHRAWARRYAETLRAQRHEIDADTKKEKADAWEKRQHERRQKRAAEEDQ